MTDLEIIIITYNREKQLEATLKYLMESRLSTLPITVLNNASTDNTLNICAQYTSILPNYLTITHKNNIGGNANIVRAFEISSSKYTWVLCDDDFLDLTDFDDVLTEINLGEADIIHVGAHKDTWAMGGMKTSPKILLDKGYSYFKFGSFLPCSIFKTSILQKQFIIPAYANIGNFYPHMPFLFSIYTNNGIIYLSKNKIVTASVGTQNYTESEWIIWWINTCKLLNTQQDVRNAFFNHFNNKQEGYKTLVKYSKKNTQLIALFIINFLNFGEIVNIIFKILLRFIKDLLIPIFRPSKNKIYSVK